MTATKRITRIGAIFLLVIFLVSSMATMALAYSASYSDRLEREVTIYKTTKAIKITRTDEGTLKSGRSTAQDYGTYTYTVKNSKGKVINSGTWNAAKKSSVTLVPATKAIGYYTVVISPASPSSTYSSLYNAFSVAPKYKFTW